LLYKKFKEKKVEIREKGERGEAIVKKKRELEGITFLEFCEGLLRVSIKG